MSNVINLNNITSLNLPPDRVISGALEKLAKVVVIGVDVDGNEYFASSVADGGDVVWMLERCKHRLMRITDSDD